MVDTGSCEVVKFKITSPICIKQNLCLYNREKLVSQVSGARSSSYLDVPEVQEFGIKILVPGQNNVCFMFYLDTNCSFMSQSTL